MYDEVERIHIGERVPRQHVDSRRVDRVGQFLGAFARAVRDRKPRDAFAGERESDRSRCAACAEQEAGPPTRIERMPLAQIAQESTTVGGVAAPAARTARQRVDAGAAPGARGDLGAER